MIKVGDYVRFSNEYLKFRVRRKNGKEFRLKNRIMRVLRVEHNNDEEVRLDPRQKHNAVVKLDVSDSDVYGPTRFGLMLAGERPLTISTHWLSFVRRRNFNPKKKIKRKNRIENMQLPHAEIVRELEI